MAQGDRHDRARLRLVSVDVFDTLLLRDLSSERRRKRDAVGIAARSLDSSPEAVAGALASARRIVDLARRVGGGQQTPLAAVAETACRLLDVPQSLAPQLVAAFREAEAARLRPSAELCRRIAAWRHDGLRVVAISDTDFSGEALAALISQVAGPGLLDAVHTSADHGVDKRSGELFRAVGRLERAGPTGWLHIGDDPVADVAAPEALGIATLHRPRSPVRLRAIRLVARLDAALAPA